MKNSNNWNFYLSVLSKKFSQEGYFEKSILANIRNFIEEKLIHLILKKYNNINILNKKSPIKNFELKKEFLYIEIEISISKENNITLIRELETDIKNLFILDLKEYDFKIEYSNILIHDEEEQMTLTLFTEEEDEININKKLNEIIVYLNEILPLYSKQSISSSGEILYKERDLKGFKIIFKIHILGIENINYLIRDLFLYINNMGFNIKDTAYNLKYFSPELIFETKKNLNN